MPAVPSESPITISSTSPTPERPGLCPARSSSSSIFAPPLAGPSSRRSHARPTATAVEEDGTFNASVDDDVLLQSAPQNGPGARRRPQPFVLMPTARAFRPASAMRVDQGLAIPSRTASPSTSNATVGSGGPGRAAGNVIDLTEDDDDVEITGVAGVGPQTRARPPRMAAQNGPMWRDLRRIDEVAAERGLAVRDILNDPDLQRRRQVLSPLPVPADRSRRTRFDVEAARRQLDEREREQLQDPPAEEQRRRIGFGGAVLRQGDRQINYDRPHRANLPARPPAPLAGANARRHNAQQMANLDAQINERIQRRIRDRDDGGYAGVADLLQGVMNNWGVAHGMDDARRAELMERMTILRAQQMWGAGPAGMANQRRLDDPQAIIAQVPKFEYPPLPDGFTSNFEIDSTIEIDQPASSKRYLACVYCADPLLLSSGQKTPLDRVWALRCGHLVDQKCLDKISSPQTEDDRANINRPPPAGLPILGENEATAAAGRGGGRKAKKARPNTRKTANKPVEYEWECPAKGCGHSHKSVLKDAEWVQTELEGALQLYA